MKFLVKDAGMGVVAEFPTKVQADSYKIEHEGKLNKWGDPARLRISEYREHPPRWKVDTRLKQEEIETALRHHGYQFQKVWDGFYVENEDAVKLIRGFKCVERVESLDWICLDCGERCTIFGINRDLNNLDTHEGYCHGCIRRRIDTTFCQHLTGNRRLPLWNPLPWRQ